MYHFPLFNYSRIPISQTSREIEGKISSRNREVREVGGKITEKCHPRDTKIGSRNREFRETEGSRNRDSTVCVIYVMIFRYL